MSFTLNLGELISVVLGAVFVGGMIESVRRLTVSSGSQGRRLGEIDKWISSHDSVSAEREKMRARADTRAGGMTAVPESIE